MTEPLVALPAIIGDIGGTNARIAVVGRDGAIRDSMVFPIGDHADFAEALADRVLPSLAEPPKSAVLAIATNIEGETIRLTHGHWSFTPRELIALFGFRDVIILNDFEALSLALPSLDESQLTPIGPALRAHAGVKLVIGPGTGFGVAALAPVGDAWLPISTEAGHIDFGPASARDFDIWPNLAPDERVKLETVLAGAGLANLYRAIAVADGKSPAKITVPEVVARARGGSDGVATEALKLFIAHFGRFSGDLALMFLPKGGIYIGGGVTARLGELFDAEAFRAAFVDKAPYRAFMESIPVWMITDPYPAFRGIAAIINDPRRYLIDLGRRHWRA